MTSPGAFLLLVSALAPASTSAAPASTEGPGVYLRLVQSSPLPFDQVSSRLEKALVEAGWTVAARMDSGVDASACSFRGRVIVAYTQAYLDRVMAAGPHAAFAVPIRFVVWEDESGVNVGATNPMNLNRTIVDEASPPQDWADVAASIRAVAGAAFPGTAAGGEYGQRRKDARIGRTMGIMAGGKFTDKLKDVVVRPAAGQTASEVAGHLFNGMAALAGEGQWKIRPVYVIDMPRYRVAIVGVTGTVMEERSFSIVRDGGDDARKSMACPGIDHAAAYPVEVSVAVLGGEVKVSLVDEMYRMKMFFENAGTMAFAKNMRMPGSIEDEIKDKIRRVLR